MLFKIIRHFVIFKVELPVFFADFTNDFAGVSCGNNIWRNILDNNAACTYNRIVAYGYPGYDNRTCSDPVIFTYADGKVVLICFSLSSGKIGCPAEATTHPGPNIVKSPTYMWVSSTIVVLKLQYTFLPK